MSLLDREVDPGAGSTDAGEEALIEEARRLRRRRWIIGCTLAAVAVGAGVVGYLASGAPSAPHHAAPNGSSTASFSAIPAHALVPTHSPDLIQPTTLATLPSGDLLILDSSRDQILELGPDGDLSVFAGNGRLGLTGDGGAARDAELDFTDFSSGGLAVAPDSAVFFDDGNCRIREISPAGIIRTVLRVPRFSVSPRGTACPLTGVAVSPSGSVYIATDSEIERLSATGHLVWVAGKRGSIADVPHHLTPSNVVLSPLSLAFNRAGDLYIGSFEPRVVYKLTPAGKLTSLGGSYPTQLSADPNGEVLVGTHFGVIQAATTGRLRDFYDVNAKRVAGINWGKDGAFQENGITVTKTGMVYVDNAQGNGYGAGTVLVRIGPAKHAALVPIRTPLDATLPKVGSPGFSASLYPPARRSRGTALSSCPSDKGLERFNPQVIAQARKIAKTYDSGQFASDIAVTDRSWWTADFNRYASGNLGGTHTVTGQTQTSESPIAAGVAQACGPELVDDSIAVTVGKSGYSDFAGTLYFLDRFGHPLVYAVT